MATEQEPVEVLRELWRADDQDTSVLDEASPAKACKNMKGVSFDGFAPPGSDIGQAWRDQLAREGKLSEGSLRDLVLGDSGTRE